jgi:hypothetical protein
MTQIGILTEIERTETVESLMWQAFSEELRPPNQDFRDKYWSEPGKFVLDCFKWSGMKPNHPTKYQLEVLEKLQSEKRACVRSPHGAGKTATAAWAILWFALTRTGMDQKWIIPTTASAWRHLKQFLWPELHFWVRRLKWDVIGRKPFNRKTELYTTRLKLDNSGEAFAMASGEEANIEGAHGQQLLFIFDEAKTIPNAIWDAAEGALSKGECYALAFSTPGRPEGRFHAIQTRKRGLEDWWVRHITKKEVIIAGMMSKKWAAQRLAQWGENSAVYQNRVEGNFATDAQNAVIPLSWVEAAIERWHAWMEATGGEGVVTSLGVDPSGGREGANAATIATCMDYVKIAKLHEMQITDPDKSAMEIAGNVRVKLRRNPQAVAYVDVIGIGSGIVARLIEMKQNVKGFHSGKSTELMDESGTVGFLNWRAAGWWFLREMLSPGSKFDVCLPPDPDGKLTGDLTTPKSSFTSRGLRQIEAKLSIKRRLGRSTDYADAVIYALIGGILCAEEDAKTQLAPLSYHPVQIGPSW